MEMTPFHQRGDIAEFCIDNGIIMLSDNPLAKDVYSTKPELVELADSLNLTVQEVEHFMCLCVVVHVVISFLSVLL